MAHTTKMTFSSSQFFKILNSIHFVELEMLYFEKSYKYLQQTLFHSSHTDANEVNHRINHGFQKAIEITKRDVTTIIHNKEQLRQ
ncbi:hypothetical protein V1478_001619 [Vespula squamosa]|uniref:Uncharacterized protein n=1 Tax=Vespula squamosa TaxID=30214 RepID=A0ABD2C3R5_VESSQ